MAEEAMIPAPVSMSAIAGELNMRADHHTSG